MKIQVVTLPQLQTYLADGWGWKEHTIFPTITILIYEMADKN